MSNERQSQMYFHNQQQARPAHWHQAPPQQQMYNQHRPNNQFFFNGPQHHFHGLPGGPQRVPVQYGINNNYNNYNNNNNNCLMWPRGNQVLNNWQGPGPSRNRGRSYQGNRGTSARYHGRGRPLDNKDMCCKCGETLQNSEEPGIHLCDGGRSVTLADITVRTASDDGEKPSTSSSSDTSSDDSEPDDLDTKLEKILESVKGCLRTKYQTVTETLEQFFTDKIDEINTLHRENVEERTTLENLKKELEEKASNLEKEEQQFREKQRQLTKDQESFNKEMTQEKEEICRRWQSLRDEIARMEEMHEMQKGRVKLDVGGNVFTTSRLTLTKDSDSMLAAMFSGRHEVMQETDGSVFIDRDGTHFRYVLNYLRDGGIRMDSLPRNRQTLKELRNEAVYYQLHGLVQQIEKYLH